MFGFISNMLSATVKAVVTPLAVVKDILVGEPFKTTEDLLESVLDDISDTIDDLIK